MGNKESQIRILMEELTEEDPYITKEKAFQTAQLIFRLKNLIKNSR